MHTGEKLDESTFLMIISWTSSEEDYILGASAKTSLGACLTELQH
jgi:hypothetical protein